MGVTTLVPDPETGKWYRNLNATRPYSYDVKVRWEPESDDPGDDPVEYWVKGLDSREVDSQAEALQMAKYRLKIEYQPDPLTNQQRLVSMDYQQAMTWLNHAIYMIESGLVTEGPNDSAVNKTINLNLRRDYALQKYIDCVLAGVYFAGNPSELEESDS